MANYFFGGFQINAFSGGLGYLLISKELSMPVVKPVTFNIARRAGAKKSGETIEPKTIPVTIKVIGSSRLDLTTKLDALQAALNLRGQNLIIHDTGTRQYQNVDCVSASTPFKAGSGVVSCEVSCVFTAYDPIVYYNTLSTYDTGTVALTLSGGVYNFASIVITGGGTTYAYPLIRLYNRTSGSHQWQSLTISQTNDSQILTATHSAATPLPISNGDYVDIQCDPAVSGGWTIQTNGNGLYVEPIGVFPVVEAGATTFAISIATASAISAQAVFSWLPRYLS